ncbi:unnamed protein product [Arctia plantaginis]|uniref:Uncharacterized protein n=1 Tax=Arctia plantaginis TaxID=874455 RepID=A0A8S0YVY1_ARCPL|nr:unnamed protein product [Arctia plantaginis]
MAVVFVISNIARTQHACVVASLLYEDCSTENCKVMEDNTNPSEWVPADTVDICCSSNERNTMLYEGNLRQLLRAANGCIVITEPLAKRQKIALMSPTAKGKGVGKKTKIILN